MQVRGNRDVLDSSRCPNFLSTVRTTDRVVISGSGGLSVAQSIGDRDLARDVLTPQYHGHSRSTKEDSRKESREDLHGRQLLRREYYAFSR